MRLLFILFLVLVLQVDQCDYEIETPKNTVIFNQLFIPIWTSLQLNNPEDAEQYAKQINLFDHKFDNQQDYGETWTEHIPSDLSVLEEAITNKEYENAKELANCIMDELHLWHEANNQNYYFDKVWDFARCYRDLNTVINDVYLSLYEWNDLEHFITEMNDSWQVLLTTPIYLDGYHFEEDPEVRKLEEYKRAISLCLQEFNSQLKDADREVLANRCNEIEENLVLMVSFFGNFTNKEEFLTLVD